MCRCSFTFLTAEHETLNIAQVLYILNVFLKVLVRIKFPFNSGALMIKEIKTRLRKTKKIVMPIMIISALIESKIRLLVFWQPKVPTVMSSIISILRM